MLEQRAVIHIFTLSQWLLSGEQQEGQGQGQTHQKGQCQSRQEVMVCVMIVLGKEVRGRF